VPFWVLALNYEKSCIGFHSLGTKVWFYSSQNKENWEALTTWKRNFEISRVTIGFSRKIAFHTVRKFFTKLRQNFSVTVGRKIYP
jgi:hypothetical protein